MINAQGIARLLKKYGRQITIRALAHAGGPAYDPSYSSIDTVAYGVIVSLHNNVSQSLAEQSLMELVTDSPVNSGYKVIDGNDQYSVISVEIVKPGPITYLYIARIGKGLVKHELR